MNYVEILSMILNSDGKLTKDYASLLQSIDTRFFIDESLISDTPYFQNTGKGFIAIYKHEGEVVLEFMHGGSSIKSCTKKVVLSFSSCLGNEVKTLKPDHLTNDIIKDTFELSSFCMNCTAYNLKRDSVDFNQIIETEIYSIDYYLRKNNNNKYFLQADLSFKKPITKNNIKLNRATIPFIMVSPDFQNILRDYVNPSSNGFGDMIDDFDEDIDNNFDDDFDEDIDNNFIDDEFCENPFDTLSKLGPGTYDLETGKFTPDDENVESEDDLFGR